APFAIEGLPAVPQAWTDPPGEPVVTLGGGSFDAVGAMAVDAHGFVFMVDGNVVRRFYPDGTLAETISGPINGSALNAPAGLALDQYRNLYIADTGNNRVVVLQPNFEDSRSGTYQAVFPNPMPAGAGLSQPSGLAIVPQRAVDDDEFLAVADTGNSRVQVFRINITGSASGTGFTNSIRATTAIARNITITALTTFGAAGNADDQFQKPVDIASDRNRRLYVCDAGLNRISRW